MERGPLSQLSLMFFKLMLIQLILNKMLKENDLRSTLMNILKNAFITFK